MRRILFLSVVLASLGWSTAAQAGTVVPPGNSGIDQYFETVPGVGGNSGVGGGGNGSGHHKQVHNSAVAPSTRQTLSHLGANGKGAAVAADVTAPTVAAIRSTTSATKGQATAAGNSSASARRTGGKPGAGSSGAAAGTSSTASSSSHVPVTTSSGGSPFSSLVSAVTAGTKGEGMGAVQPIILMLVLVGAAAYLWHRRRRNA